MVERSRRLLSTVFCLLSLSDKLSQVLLGEGSAKSQREGLVIRVVRGDAGSLGYFAFVPVGLGNLESHAPDLAGGDDLVIFAGRAPAGRADALYFQIDLSFVLDFKSVG